MTSKNSLFDVSLLRQRMKRLNWLVFLFSTGLFFGYPVAAALMAQDLTTYVQARQANPSAYTPDDAFWLETHIRSRAQVLFSSDNKAILVLVSIAAIIAAAVLFYYLNNKKQIDFYHSQPLTRAKLFITNFLAGFVVFFVPYLIAIALSALVWALFGFGAYLSASFVFLGVGTVLLFFLVIYLISLTALLLCGHTVVGLLNVGVFFALPPVYYALAHGYMETFFDTFYGSMVDSMGILRNLSPFLDFIAMNVSRDFSALRVAAYAVLCILLFSVCLALYRSRRSEMAGKSMAYRAAKPIIKFAILTVVVAGFGLLFWEIGHRYYAWMAFGFACGAFFGHCFIEVIYEFDFRAMFRKVKPMAAFLAAFVLMISVPVFDLAGYDRKLPGEGALGSVSVNLPNMWSANFFFNDYGYYYMNSSRSSYYVSSEALRMKRMTLTDPANIRAAVEIARLGVAGAEHGVNLEPGESLEYAGLGFHNRTGGSFYRYYRHIKQSDLLPYMYAIYDTDEFKQKFYDLLWIKTQADVPPLVSVEWFNHATAVGSSISDPAKVHALYEALCRDLMKLDSSYLESHVPLLELTFRFGDDADINKTVLSCVVPLYENCAEGMALLAGYGVNAGERITAEDVDAIIVRNLNYDEKAYGYPDKTVPEYAYPTAEAKPIPTEGGIRVTDKGQIGEILDSAMPSTAVRQGIFYAGTENNLMITVYSAEFNNGYNVDWVFHRDDIPDFVTELLAFPS